MRWALILALGCVACDEAPVGGATSQPRAVASAGARAAVGAAAASATASEAIGSAPTARASAARKPPPLSSDRAPRPHALLAAPPRAEHGAWRGPVDPSGDRTALLRLASSPVSQAEPNRGGATVTIRMQLPGGTRALFKPEQKHPASNYRAEIAAYHLDRLLGFGRTAPVVGRRFRADALRAALADADPKWLERFDESVPVRDGRIAGAMIGWHEGKLTDAAPSKGWTAPFGEADAGPLPARAAEWVDLVVFDLLIDNPDRWSGGNVLALGKDGPLIFLDNAAGFFDFRVQAHKTTFERVQPICRFPRDTVEALRAARGALGKQLEASLSHDPLAPVLSSAHIAAVDRRLEQLLAHVDGCKARLGDAALFEPTRE